MGERAIVKEKMLKLENYLKRKKTEGSMRTKEVERLNLKRLEHDLEVQGLTADAVAERELCSQAREEMEYELQRLLETNRNRAMFESRRQEVALEAANNAFNASAGRLRKLYAIEKLQGNYLQHFSQEQVETSQTTENNFQQIREVTGLTDVMDIVHKFLNRDVEQEQLKDTVQDAESKLEGLREQFLAFKRDTDGLTFDTELTGRSRTIYLEFEENEAALSQAIKAHEQSRAKLQQSTLQIEHMKRWANRMAGSLKMFEDCVRVDKPADLPIYFQQMQRAVDKSIAHIVQQI